MIFRTMAKLLIGFLVFIGLPLLGWGILDAAEFFINPVRLGYVALTVLVQTGVVLLIPSAGRGSGGGKVLIRRQRLALVFIQVLSLALVIGAPYCDRRSIVSLGSSDAIRYIGLSLYLIGMILMHWAEYVLGRQFSIDITIQEGHRLITNGPCRYLRHPRYLGILIFSVGASLVFRSLLGFLPVTLLVGVLAWRIHDEEALLRKQLGDEWEAYSKRSWRLIPFVY
jgi:protein-S-isoprenylcysteine O-methyltransferase Ste14